MAHIFPQTPKGCYRLGLNVFFFILGLNFASWASRIPDVQSALGLNDAELGTAMFAAPLGQLPCMLVAGVLINRFGSLKILVIGMALYSSALVCIGLAESFWQLAAGLFFFGIGGNLFDLSINTQAVGLERIYRQSIMSSFHGLWSLGGVAGGAAGTLLATFMVSPSAHFIGIAIFSVLGYIVFRSWLLPRDVSALQDTMPNKQIKPAKKRLPRPDLLLILLGLLGFCCMSVEGTMYDWNAVYFATVVQAPPELVRLGYIVCMLFMVTGRFMADGFITRFGYVSVLRGSGLCMCCGLTLFIVQDGILLSTLASAFTGFGMASGVPICFSLAGKSKKIPPSIAISMVVFLSFWGFMLCPPIIGHLSHAFNLRLALLPVAALSLITALVAPLLKYQNLGQPSQRYKT